MEKIKISKKELQDEIELLTDLYTDDLFNNKSCNVINSKVSRLVCDMERFKDDFLETMSKIGMGAVYTKTCNGKNLVEDNKDYRNMIISEYYDKYHLKFEKLTDNVLKNYNRCIIIDGHSFSVELLKKLKKKHIDCPDICIGFEKKFCDNNILSMIKKHFENNNLTVKFNYPYGGSIVPNKYYDKSNQKIISLMIEINKSLYLDKNNCRNKNYKIIKKIINDGIELIIDYENNNRDI